MTTRQLVKQFQDDIKYLKRKLEMCRRGSPAMRRTEKMIVLTEDALLVARLRAAAKSTFKIRVSSNPIAIEEDFYIPRKRR